MHVRHPLRTDGSGMSDGPIDVGVYHLPLEVNRFWRGFALTTLKAPEVEESDPSAIHVAFCTLRRMAWIDVGHLVTVTWENLR